MAEFRLTYDSEASAAYVYVSDGAMARTVELVENPLHHAARPEATAVRERHRQLTLADRVDGLRSV